MVMTRSTLAPTSTLRTAAVAVLLFWLAHPLPGQVGPALDRAQAWLAAAQNADGSFGALAAIDSGATWLELVFRCVVFVVAAALVLPVCADAISQMRSNHRDFAGGGASSVSFQIACWFMLSRFCLRFLRSHCCVIWSGLGSCLR